MRGWGTLFLIIAYPFAEFVTASWVASQVGWMWVFVFLGAFFLLGTFFMRLAGASAFRALSDVSRGNAGFEMTGVDGQGQTVMASAAEREAAARQAGKDLGSSMFLFLAGILVAIPGFITSVVGLVLALPPVRSRLARSVRRRAEAAAARSQSTITIVQAETDGHTTVYRAQQWGDTPRRPDSGHRPPPGIGPGPVIDESGAVIDPDDDR